LRTRSRPAGCFATVVVAACLSAITLTGCATDRNTRKGLFPHDVTVSTKPEGAKLMVWSSREGEPKRLVVVGLTPQTITINAPATVVMHKAGFRAVGVRLALNESVEISLEPTEEDGFREEIWGRGTFQGYEVSFKDAQIRRWAYVSDTELPSEIRRAVFLGELIHGMTPEQVRATLGKPQAVVTREMGEFVEHKWIYEGKELFFEGAVLLTWKE